MDKDQLMEVCLLAGRILVEAGSEIYRVEDTMRHIAFCGHEMDNAAFTSLTGVLISFKQAPYTRFTQVVRRGIDMNRIAQVNTLSRQFEAGDISLDDFQIALKAIQASPPPFSLAMQTFGAGLESACLMIIFTQKYDWHDFLFAFVIGAIGYWVAIVLGQHTRLRFIGELLGAFVIAMLTLLAVKYLGGQNVNNIIIGAIMPLVPGVPMTNALRDLFEGNLLAGIERGIESSMVVGAIAVGVGIAFYLV
ncbi:threonine/serine exporter family protein [Bombilactobacillus folatiphilus]|uniref:Threonine/serine exporter family protein n=1 Tax=Bombilactobacillus folatiphilus TaxID=2923362 RepID=A0ABY4P9J9_9LACO|nr:threonine/serine exporter family protein [Bombilactobacillus folatiphilus]UQS82062.1 threonine/serine exporter family protein [Bombilactobacillus folatiphilus]